MWCTEGNRAAANSTADSICRLNQVVTRHDPTLYVPRVSFFAVKGDLLNRNSAVGKPSGPAAVGCGQRTRLSADAGFKIRIADPPAWTSWNSGVSLVDFVRTFDTKVEALERIEGKNKR
jgi:hypothetical protein